MRWVERVGGLLEMTDIEADKVGADYIGSDSVAEHDESELTHHQDERAGADLLPRRMIPDEISNAHPSLIDSLMSGGKQENRLRWSPGLVFG